MERRSGRSGRERSHPSMGGCFAAAAAWAHPASGASRRSHTLAGCHASGEAPGRTICRSVAAAHHAALLWATLLLGCEPPGRVFLRDADEAFSRGDFEQAAAAYAELPFVVGETWRAYGAFRAAVTWRDALHDPRRAEGLFQDCGRHFPETDWGYACTIELGDLRRDTWNPRGAIEAYRSAIQSRPGGSYTEHALVEAGRAYLSLSEYAQARAEWAELRRLLPQTERAGEIDLLEARSYELEGVPRQALAAWDRILGGQPSPEARERALLGRAEALAAVGDYQKAEEAFQKALAESGSPDAVLPLLEALRQRERRRSAGTMGMLNEVLAAQSGHGGEQDDGADLPPL